MAKKPDVGEPAPDFELPGTGGTFRLSEHRGERVVLLFYPGDNTTVCTKQFCSYRDNSEAFGALDATVVGISGQSVESHEGFTEKHSLNVPLLADEDGSVAKSYGAHAPLLGTKRAVIIVDEDGVVRHRHDHLLGLDFQSVADLRDALATLPARAAAVTDTLVIPERFSGPPGSANGGYTCGLVAQQLGAEEVEVTLRSPPPLERPLAVIPTGDGGVEVREGETLVAEARPAELREDIPDAVARDELVAAEKHHRERWTAHHPFPNCFVCGPDREQGDGMRLFPVELPGREDLFGVPWTPDETVADDTGHVRPECVWAALDCPTSAPVANWAAGPPIVLARLTARLGCPVLAGEDHSILSWELGRDGRKRDAAAALYDSQGRLLCASRALWIELRTG